VDVLTGSVTHVPPVICPSGSSIAQNLTVNYATVGLVLLELRTGMMQAQDLYDFQNISVP
jgi:hypothetical protein